jgi:hypothetical protein
MVIQEQYPDLKSNQNFMALQSQLEGTENRITIARRDYNETAQKYNTTLRTFPSVFWAKTMYAARSPPCCSRPRPRRSRRRPSASTRPRPPRPRLRRRPSKLNTLVLLPRVRGRGWAAALLATLCLSLMLPALALAAPKFPALSGRVVDEANILSPQVEQDLTTKLKTLEDSTGRQLVVATVSTPARL